MSGTAAARLDLEAEETILVGLAGRGIGASRTPAMHEAEAAKLGRRLVYRLLDADTMPGAPDIGALVRAAELCGFAGLNVTFPFKIAAIEHLDELSEDARAVGAVNTVVFRDGKRVGHNTDLWGFAQGFRRDMAGVARGRVLLIGAGGAGVAVAHALADCGVDELAIFDLERQRAADLVERLLANRPGLAVSILPDLDRAGAGFDGLVNATPVGMAKLPGMPFPAGRLRPPMWVADIVYFPLETELLRAARTAGCRTLPGAGMAVFQAVRAFELFTGLRPASDRMQATFDSFGAGRAAGPTT